MSIKNSIYNLIGCLKLVYVILNEICLIFIKILANSFRFFFFVNLGGKHTPLELSF